VPGDGGEGGGIGNDAEGLIGVAIVDGKWKHQANYRHTPGFDIAEDSPQTVAFRHVEPMRWYKVDIFINWQNNTYKVRLVLAVDRHAVAVDDRCRGAVSTVSRCASTTTPWSWTCRLWAQKRLVWACTRSTRTSFGSMRHVGRFLLLISLLPLSRACVLSPSPAVFAGTPSARTKVHLSHRALCLSQVYVGPEHTFNFECPQTLSDQNLRMKRPIQSGWVMTGANASACRVPCCRVHDALTTIAHLCGYHRLVIVVTVVLCVDEQTSVRTRRSSTRRGT
jgi:hypothetical protein